MEKEITILSETRMMECVRKMTRIAVNTFDDKHQYSKNIENEAWF